MKPNYWTTHEINTLRENINAAPNDLLKLLPRHTLFMIFNKISELCLKRDPINPQWLNWTTFPTEDPSFNNVCVAKRSFMNRKYCHSPDDNPFDLTPEFMYDLWLDQGGCCALTGLEMFTPGNSPTHHHPLMGSVDRIDSNGDYTRDNVRWVCYWANLSKNEYADATFYDMCRAAVATAFRNGRITRNS